MVLVQARGMARNAWKTFSESLLQIQGFFCRVCFAASQKTPAPPSRLEACLPSGANICWAYGHALHILGASGDPAAGFPESEVSAVAPDAGNLRGRRPRSAGLLLALDYGPWIAAGHTVEAIIPTSYVEGPLWGLADGFGIPANVFGGWGFSSGRAASRKRRKAMKLANKAKRKADRAAEKTRRVALASKERQRRHGTTSGGPGSGVFGRELCDVFDEVAAADENSLSEEETKDAGHATAGEGPPLEIEADESPAGEECGGDFDNESVPVGTFVLDTSGEALLVKLRQAPRGGGFSTWRNLPLHTALLDGRLMTVDRTEKVEGGRSADDWAILSRAAQTQGMVVSNDRYREHRRMFRYAPGQRVLRVGYEFLQEAETSEGRGLELKFHPHVGVGT